MFQIENETNLIISFNQNKLSFNTNENSENSNEDIVKFLINLSEEIHSDNISIEDKKTKIKSQMILILKKYIYFSMIYFLILLKISKKIIKMKKIN